MTNDQFLSLVFKNKPANGHIFTVSFPGDPAHGDYRFTPFLPPTNNNFFCVSTLSSVERRVPNAFVSLHVLVVDDVGTKVRHSTVLHQLQTPTYVIETSRENYQYGYVLEDPITDRATAEGLIQALCRAFTSDVAGVNRLVRLPVGMNGKPGKNEFKTILVDFRADLLYSSSVLIEALQATPVDPASFTSQPFLPPDRDPVLIALTNNGLHWEQGRDPGIYKITCPWVSDHTGGRDDGTAYLAPAGFRCWHGHCHSKTFADLRRYLGLSATEVDDAIVEAAFGVMTLQPGEVYEHPETFELRRDPEQKKKLDEAYDAAVIETQRVLAPVVPERTTDTPQGHPWDNSTFHFLFRDGKIIPRAEREKMFPRHWLFKDLIPMGTPWAIAGEGGLGKSRLGLLMCMSVASGIPLGDTFIPAAEPSPVLFLTQEDDTVDRVHRFGTQYDLLAGRDPRWRDDRVLHRLLDNLFVPQLTFGQQLDQRFMERVATFAAARGPLRLMLFDPLVLFWDHTNPEQSINSAAGVVATFRRLIMAARQGCQDNFWSAGMLHHMNKEGTSFYGSVMIANHVRTLFELTKATDIPDEDYKFVKLTCKKSNSTNKTDSSWVFELDRETAAIYPREEFAWESEDERLAAIVRNAGSVTQTDLKKLAKERGIENAQAIMGRWSGQPERMAELGITKGRHNRFELAVTVGD